MGTSPEPIAKLALEDGSVFTGRSFGVAGVNSGEVVFNTSMTGYQEILTDPSYRGQIVTMTYPLIGNYGINRQDVESRKVHVAGFIIRELAPRYSNYRADMSLQAYLKENKIVAMQGIDIEAAVGRKLTSKSEEEEEEKPGTPKREADEEIGGESKRARSESESEDEEVKKDEEGNTELVDADGEPKASEDAVDTSTV